MIQNGTDHCTDHIDSITCDLRDNLVGNNPGIKFGKLQGAQDRRTTKDKKRKFPRIIETDAQN